MAKQKKIVNGDKAGMVKAKASKARKAEIAKRKPFGPQVKSKSKSLTANEKKLAASKTKQRATQRKATKTKATQEGRKRDMSQARAKGTAVNERYADYTGLLEKRAAKANDKAKKKVATGKKTVKADTKSAKSLVPYKTKAAAKKGKAKSKKK